MFISRSGEPGNEATFHTVSNKHCTRFGTHLYTYYTIYQKMEGMRLCWLRSKALDQLLVTCNIETVLQATSFGAGWMREGLGMWLGLCELWWWKVTYQKPWLSRYLVRSTFTFGSCTCGRHEEEKKDILGR